jgi:hypothetical protein
MKPPPPPKVVFTGDCGGRRRTKEHCFFKGLIVSIKPFPINNVLAKQMQPDRPDGPLGPSTYLTTRETTKCKKNVAGFIKNELSLCTAHSSVCLALHRPGWLQIQFSGATYHFVE